MNVRATEQQSLKIFAIGNSFSEDSTEYLAVIAEDLGIKDYVFGNAYIGGCSIATHAQNARDDAPAYRYDKMTTRILMSNATKTKEVTLDTMLRDEEWDIITLQQKSGDSGKPSTYNEDIDYLISYIKERCPNAKLAWNMTWAYQSDYDGSSFKYYNNDQMKMYEKICSAVQQKIEPNDSFDYIIPAGTAIQNARTGERGDTFNRDGIHLDLTIGRYIVGVTWFRSLGYSLDNLKTLPQRVKKTELEFIKEVVENAVANPYSVTPYGTAPETSAPETEQASEANTQSHTEQSTQQSVQEPIAKTNLTPVLIAIAAVAVILAAAVVFLLIKKR